MFLRIPVGTSPELCELLTGLLKRNARERMNFETFFNHKFLQRPEPPISQSPLQTVDLPLPNIYGSPPPSLPRVTPLRSATPIKIANTPPASQPGIISYIYLLVFYRSGVAIPAHECSDARSYSRSIILCIHLSVLTIEDDRCFPNI